jgi:hypothetical protein
VRDFCSYKMTSSSEILVEVKTGGGRISLVLRLDFDFLSNFRKSVGISRNNVYHFGASKRDVKASRFCARSMWYN